MPRRPILLAAAAALLAAACAPDVESFAPDTTRPEGPRFLAQAVDVRENAGVGLGVAVDGGGAPNISYFRLDERERIPLAPEPADPQFLPAVMVASLGNDGVWTRTIVAQEALATGAAAPAPTPGPTVTPDPDAEPAPEPKFEDLGPDDTTDVAVDGEGNRHVAWTNGNRAVQYAGEGDGFPSLPEDTLQTVAEGTVSGVSVAVGENGAPWIAFYDGDGVKAATRSGETWTVEDVAAARAEDGFRTDLAVAGGTPVVAFGADDATVVARRGEDGWETETVHDGGYGVSLATDESGDPVVASVSEDGTVRVDDQVVAENVEAPTPPASPAPDAAPPPRPSTGVAVDRDGTVWAAWGDGGGVKYASDADEFAPHEMPAGFSGADPHLAAGPQGPVAGWYQFDSTSLTGAVFTEEDPQLAVPSPDASLGGGGGTAECEPNGTELAVVAPPGAAANGFEQDCLAAPAGQAFTIDFDNQDEGQLHNVAIYTESGGDQLFAGDNITGPDQTTYSVDALEPGTLFFQCDVHPTTMTGTFVSAGEGGEGGSGGGGGGASPDAGQGGESPATPSPTTG